MCWYPSSTLSTAPYPDEVDPIAVPTTADCAGDGSLTQGDPNGAFGAVISSDSPTTCRYQFRVANRPEELSSHVAELQSMVHANRIAPTHSTGTLFQDSKSAICVYDKVCKAPLHASQWSLKLSSDPNRFSIRCLMTGGKWIY